MIETPYSILVKLDYLLLSTLKGTKKDCPFCKSKNQKVVSKKFTTRIVQCADCLLYFTRPIYRPFILKSLYERFSDRSAAYKVPTESEIQELKKNHFRSLRDFSFALNSIVPRHPQGSSILEIGSSWGYFLHQAKEVGLDPTGIEISNNRRDVGNSHVGVNIKGGFDQLEGKQFDLVFTFHVLEHFTDLSTVFKDIYNHLKDDGTLYLEVPNFDFEKQGSTVLPIVGAVHPIGFHTDFFKKNLPKIGFKSLEFYEKWEEIPSNPVDHCSGALVVVAKK